MMKLKKKPVLTLETHDYNHVVGTFHPEGKLKKKMKQDF